MKYRSSRFDDKPAMSVAESEIGGNAVGLTSKNVLLIFGLVCLLYLASLAIVGISGDFPINDDWAWATTTREFVRTGVYRPSDWGAMTLITHVIYGAPFCAVSSCSFEALRVSTLLAAIVLLGMVCALVRLATTSATLIVAAAVIALFNPLTYSLSMTFMTDILFAMLIVTGAVCFIKSLQEESVVFTVVGTIIAVAATLTRQLGLCLPLAYLVVIMLQMVQARRWRWRALGCSTPLLVCLMALLGLRLWLIVHQRLPFSYDLKTNNILRVLSSPTQLILRVGNNLSTTFLYLGLFCLPVLLLVLRTGSHRPTATRHHRFLAHGVAVFVTALVVGNMVLKHRLMPSGGNLLVSQGIGPMFLRDYMMGISNLPSLPPLFWLVVTIMSCVGAFLLVDNIALTIIVISLDVFNKAQHSTNVGKLYILLAVLTYLAPLMFIPFYDRYLVPILPLIMYLLIAKTSLLNYRSWLVMPAFALIGFTFAFSVLATHDYMAWNRARWTAINNLEATKDVGVSEIDGGMEYNCLKGYRPNANPSDGRDWWCTEFNRDAYVIAFGPIAGMDAIARYEYRVFLPPSLRSISVLIRRE